VSATRKLPWGDRLRAAASLITSGAVAAGRFGPFVTARDWDSRFRADDISVTTDSALQVSAVYACVHLLSDTVAQSPIGVFKKEGDRRVPQPDHPVSKLFAGNVNDYQSRRGMLRTGETCRQLHGNAYLQIERDGDAPVGLWPLHAAPIRTNGKLVYQATAGRQSVELSPSDVVHVRGLSLDGLNGLSPIAMARNAIVLSQYAEKFGSKFFKNDARSGGYIIQPGATNLRGKKIQQDAVSSGEDSGQGGLENAHKPKFLDPGAKYIPVTIAPEEAQFLETRGFQLEEIARLYRVPLVLLQSMEKTTSWGTGVEQLMIGFVQWTIAPLAIDWEQELSAKLLTDEERAQGFYIRLDLRGLLRGDMAARAAFYQSAVQNSWMTPNEVHAREELDPIPGGDVPLRPLNMAPDNSTPANDNA
jgi:HK97 family phage portal protein